MEIWKDIAGYEGMYAVSNHGRVRSIITDRILKTSNAHPTYALVTLYQDKKRRRFYVHRLVAQAFIPMIVNKPFINHIDGDHHNNHVSNLEWCDSIDNNNHMYDIGSNKSAHRVMLKCLTTSKTHSFRSESQASIYLNRNIDYVSKARRTGRKIVENSANKRYRII